MTEQELTVKVEYAFSHEFNHTLHAYIDITKDLIAGTLLSQILYWFSPDRNGQRKVKIIKDGNYWLAKKRDEWYEEIRISPKQYDRAVAVLVAEGFVETKKYKFDGSPTTHIRPLYNNINTALAEWKEEKAKDVLSGDIPNGENDIDETGNWNFPKGQIPTIPNGENDIDETGNSLTETTAETKPETTSNNNMSEFETLWKIYPRKIGKNKALKAYIKARKEGISFEMVEQGIKAYCEYIKKSKVKDEYIKHGSTWFNGQCWNDEYTEQKAETEDNTKYGGTWV